MSVKKKLFGTKKFYLSAFMLAIPVMAQNLVQNLVNLIDNFMVSGLGDIKMSGTSVAGETMFVYMVLLNAVCMSGGIFLTQYFGAKDGHGMKQAVYFKSILGLILCLAFMFMALVIPKEVLSLLVIGNNQADLILAEGVKYMRVMSLTCFPMVVSYVFASSLKETGNVNTPLIISLIAAAINMCFNYLLIYGNFGFPRLEVVGAALATVIARISEALMYYCYVKRTDAPFMIRLKGFKHSDIKLFKNMLKRSVMVIVSEALWAFTETVATAVYNGKGGADVVSGMSASFTVANLYFVAFGGVNVATSVILGKLLGEGKLDEAKEKKRWLSSGSIVFSLVVTALAVGTSYLVPIIYSNLSIAAQTICQNMVFYMALLMPLWIILNVQLAVSRSGGDTKMGFIIDGLGNVFVVIPLTILLASFTKIGPVEIYIYTKVVDLIKIIACYIWLRKEKWVVNLTTN